MHTVFGRSENLPGEGVQMILESFEERCTWYTWYTLLHDLTAIPRLSAEGGTGLAGSHRAQYSTDVLKVQIEEAAGMEFKEGRLSLSPPHAIFCLFRPVVLISPPPFGKRRKRCQKANRPSAKRAR